MVRSWKYGKVKIDVIEFQVNEGVIVEVIDSPIQGIKFFRYKKFSLNIIKDFAKDAKEMKE